MKIIVNGQPKELLSSINLQNLIKESCKNGQHVIAEVNGDIVKHQAWAAHSIKDGDQIELVSIVGGG